MPDEKPTPEEKPSQPREFYIPDEMTEPDLCALIHEMKPHMSYAEIAKRMGWKRCTIFQYHQKQEPDPKRVVKIPKPSGSDSLARYRLGITQGMSRIDAAFFAGARSPEQAEAWAKKWDGDGGADPFTALLDANGCSDEQIAKKLGELLHFKDEVVGKNGRIRKKPNGQIQLKASQLLLEIKRRIGSSRLEEKDEKPAQPIFIPPNSPLAKMLQGTVWGGKDGKMPEALKKHIQIAPGPVVDIKAESSSN